MGGKTYAKKALLLNLFDSRAAAVSIVGDSIAQSNNGLPELVIDSAG